MLKWDNMQLSSPPARVIRHRSLPCLCPGYSHMHRSSCTVAMGRKQPGHHLLCPGPWHLTGSTHVATVTNTFTFLQMKVLSSIQSLSVGDQYRYNNKWNSEHFPVKCFLTCVYECVCGGVSPLHLSTLVVWKENKTKMTKGVRYKAVHILYKCTDPGF